MFNVCANMIYSVSYLKAAGSSQTFSLSNAEIKHMVGQESPLTGGGSLLRVKQGLISKLRGPSGQEGGGVPEQTRARLNVSAALPSRITSSLPPPPPPQPPSHQLRCEGWHFPVNKGEGDALPHLLPLTASLLQSPVLSIFVAHV